MGAGEAAPQGAPVAAHASGRERPAPRVWLVRGPSRGGGLTSSGRRRSARRGSAVASLTLFHPVTPRRVERRDVVRERRAGREDVGNRPATRQLVRELRHDSGIAVMEKGQYRNRLGDEKRRRAWRGVAPFWCTRRRAVLPALCAKAEAVRSGTHDFNRVRPRRCRRREERGE